MLNCGVENLKGLIEIDVARIDLTAFTQTLVFYFIDLWGKE